MLSVQGCYLRILPVQITLRLTPRCTSMQKRPCHAGLNAWHRDLALEDLVTDMSLSSSSSSYIQQLLHQSGVCYGRVSNNLPQPSDVLNLIKSNGITRIRLFKADPDALKPFSGIRIQLMIGVPNEALPSLANGIVN
ncbi:unnamed protein product [Ilex paraguariensis]|uniref:Glucan endo-1,3-beta-D-glucosidase n=1 Tax=Ilex paraguariensis TaxID=185542 RepID=A0ABC8RVS4_9AQUA